MTSFHQSKPAIDSQWMARAACKNWPVHMFFPNHDLTANHVSAEVKRVCAGCPVRAECLEYALQTGSQGFWAGTGDRARRRIHRTCEPCRECAFRDCKDRPCRH